VLGLLLVYIASNQILCFINMRKYFLSLNKILCFEKFYLGFAPERYIFFFTWVSRKIEFSHKGSIDVKSSRTHGN
jgi:hypothetical protein